MEIKVSSCWGMWIGLNPVDAIVYLGSSMKFLVSTSLLCSVTLFYINEFALTAGTYPAYFGITMFFLSTELNYKKPVRILQGKTAIAGGKRFTYSFAHVVVTGSVHILLGPGEEVVLGD